MVQLFVANVSKQVVQFAYRALERPGIVTQPIPIGGQIQVSPHGSKTDLSTPEIDYILDQYRKYGLIDINEVHNSKDPFHGMCYSIGKPMTADKLHKAMKRNEEALEKQGKQIRMEAAIAVNNQIEKTIGANLKELEMSVTEVEPRGGYPDDREPLGEGIRVAREPGEPVGNTLPFIGRGRKNA